MSRLKDKKAPEASKPIPRRRDPDPEEQLKVAREMMRRYRHILRELANK